MSVHSYWRLLGIAGLSPLLAGIGIAHDDNEMSATPASADSTDPDHGKIVKRLQNPLSNLIVLPF